MKDDNEEDRPKGDERQYEDLDEESTIFELIEENRLRVTRVLNEYNVSLAQDMKDIAFVYHPTT